MDDASRLCWVEVMESTKAIDATFAMMDVIMIMNQRYGISFKELLTDNGSEFCGGVKTMMEHPFERLLLHFGITHRRTKPYRPQTNGKIERFWRTFEEDVIDGAVYNNLDELKESVLGYNLYYNEHRPHQSLNGKKPIDSAVIKN
jgi:transposase InsO family protein